MLAFNQLMLAPLGAGDLIDRTVRLYRRHFMALIRAAAPPIVVTAIGAVLWTIGVREISATASGGMLVVYFMTAAAGVALILVGYLVHLIVMGGASRSLVRHLLWDEPVTARDIYRSMFARFWKLLGATFLVGLWVSISSGVAVVAWYFVVLLAVLVSVLLGATLLPYWLAAFIALSLVLVSAFGALYLFFLLAGRLAYVPQVLLVEGCGIFDAIGRSVSLARGNVRRLMAMFIFTTFTTYSALMLLLIPLGWYGYLNGVDPFSLNAQDQPLWYAIGSQVVWQCASILLTPVWMLGLSLLYVDERVRHEGYDIELMAARVFGEMPALADGRVAPIVPAISAATTDQTEIFANPKASDGSVLGLARSAKW